MMQRRRTTGWIFLLVLGIAGWSGEARAQKLKLRSSVDFRPIPTVFVFDTQRKTSALSDSNGVTLLDDFGNRDTLIFQHPSYKNLRIVKSDLSEWAYTLILEAAYRDIHEVTIVGARAEEKASEVPFQIKSIDAKDIEIANASTTADLLGRNGQVLVQKSQLGGGSPIIRGFEANRVLMVVDGVRLNNAIYRSGHLQNVITLDNSIMERVEVLFGPGSVIYGSDALGGVMHFVTRSPELARGDTNSFKLNGYYRYGSASSENTMHADLEWGSRKVGLLSSATVSSFGDLRMGNQRRSEYPDFGKVFEFADQQDGDDVVRSNSDPNVQRNSGYQQYDFLQKVLYRPNSELDLTLNAQYSTSSNIPRYDRLTEYRDGALRFARWDYGPQERLLTSVSATKRAERGPFNTARFTLAYQFVEESRINRRFGSEETSHREESVNIGSFNADLRKIIDTTNSFYYGAELIFNDVRSNAFSQNNRTGARGTIATRYPDGGSHLYSGAVYLSYKRKWNNVITTNTGVRYSHIDLESKLDSVPYDLPFNRISINTGALTGSIGVVATPNPEWRFTAVASSGFRAPNVDDYGKIFDNGDHLVVPNDQLDPEYVYNLELGAARRLFGDRLHLWVNGYRAWLRNVIVRRETQIGEADSLEFEGELLNLQANTNSNEGVITGFSAGASMSLTEFIGLDANYTITRGTDLTDDVPLGHIPPEFGRAGLSYKSKKFNGNFFTLWNGWKRIEDYSPSGVDNEDQATPDGTPSWYTLNLSGMYNLNQFVSLQVAVENLMDQHYKPFASGISAAGRNFVFTLRSRL